MENTLRLLIEGGSVMVPLLLVSAIAMAIAIERLLSWRGSADRETIEERFHRREIRARTDATELRPYSTAPVARLITADDNDHHGQIIEVSDSSRQSSVTRMALAVKPKDRRR